VDVRELTLFEGDGQGLDLVGLQVYGNRGILCVYMERRDTCQEHQERRTLVSSSTSHTFWQNRPSKHRTDAPSKTVK
jgi:hypothetical protein